MKERRTRPTKVVGVKVELLEGEGGFVEDLESSPSLLSAAGEVGEDAVVAIGVDFFVEDLEGVERPVDQVWISRRELRGFQGFGMESAVDGRGQEERMEGDFGSCGGLTGRKESIEATVDKRRNCITYADFLKLDSSSICCYPSIMNTRRCCCCSCLHHHLSLLGKYLTPASTLAPPYSTHNASILVLGIQLIPPSYSSAVSTWVLPEFHPCQTDVNVRKRPVQKSDRVG